MKRISVCFATLVFFVTVATVSYGAEPKIVASSLSDRYHLSTCKVAGKIHKEDLIVYGAPEEAVGAGLNPCKKCDPPTTSVRRSDKKVEKSSV